MNDPERLLTSRAATREERALLEAGIAEEPPPEGMHELALALGLEPVSGSAAPAPPADAATAAPMASAALGKWVALSTVGAALVGGAVYLASLSSPAQRAPTPSSAVRRGADPEAPAASAPAAPTERSEELAKRRASSSLEESARTGSLADEIAQLDGARRALKRRDGAAALRKLDGYDRGFARGALREEAELLRIEALAMAGRAAEARALAEAFARAHPGSVHGARLRALLGSL